MKLPMPPRERAKKIRAATSVSAGATRPDAADPAEPHSGAALPARANRRSPARADLVQGNDIGVGTGRFLIEGVTAAGNGTPGPRAGTKGDQVQAAIRGFLASGEIGPGEKISLRNLASALGVSVMPVRHAVSQLQSDGVLEVEPGKAVRVPVMTRAQFRSLLEIRMEIEGFAAERAALARDEQDLKAIEEQEASFRIMAVGKATRRSGAARVNMEFHFAVYRASKMPLLVDIIERLWLKAGPVIFYHIYLEKYPSPSRDSVRLHRLAIDAIRDRDGTAARAAIVEDLHQAGLRVLAEDIFREP